MIAEIEIQNFKSLERVDLRLGSFNLLIGANASGKSNFFEALRVLQGIGYGFTIAEILDGKPKSAASEVWEPIRGGSSKALFVSRDGKSSASPHVIRFSVVLRPRIGDGRDLSYSLSLSPNDGLVCQESLAAGPDLVYKATYVTDLSTGPGLLTRYQQGHKRHSRTKPVLHQIIQEVGLLESDRLAIEKCIDSLKDTQRLEPSPARLREYSSSRMALRMGEHGEDFAALITAILAIDDAKSSYVSWLLQLTPKELDDVEILRGALQEPLFAIRERGITFPAPVLSDGTLRFAAIAAAFFQSDMPEIISIEEIETGLHPSRLRLMLELLKSQAGARGTQVFATTHSPLVLAWLDEQDYAYTFFCRRDEEAGASIIKPLSEIPGFIDLARSQAIADLFAEGWFEDAI